MGITISVPDALRQSVEAASGGRNTVIYDAKGYPSIVVVIPRFRLEDIDPSLGSGTHPAFVVNGVVKPEFFVGKFKAAIHDGVALSLPAQDPAAGLNFDQARAACVAKGPGWHLMTNAEWVAIALWCWKNGHMPRGNSDWGRSSDAGYETGRRIDGGAPGTITGSGRTLTGSGPVSWSHDNTTAGVVEMAGNVWEWVGGLRVQTGEIQVIADNNAANPTQDQTAGSAHWRAISKMDGALVVPGTPGTLKYDSTSPGTSGVVGAPVLTDTVVNSNSSGSGDDGYASAPFAALTTQAGIAPPAILKVLGLFPIGEGLGGDLLQVRNYGERIPVRGGVWSYGAGAGIFTLAMNTTRTYTGSDIGFRPAYIL